MGWAVGWDSDHGRWRGYGVPAYCDAKGCRAEIDRGLGFVCECYDHDEDDVLAVTVFLCGEHTCADVDEDALPPEHPRWLTHVLGDETWGQWRDENPEATAAYRAALDEAAS